MFSHNRIFIYFFILAEHTSDDHSMPNMDGDNEGKLDAMYASMEPSGTSTSESHDSDPSKCEIR